eukprot:scaffold142037_cov31-Tisochrysis_lutea.AAC.1
MPAEADPSTSLFPACASPVRDPPLPSSPLLCTNHHINNTHNLSTPSQTPTAISHQPSQPHELYVERRDGVLSSVDCVEGVLLARLSYWASN